MPRSDPRPGPFRSPAALACFFLTAATGLALDLWTKNLAFARLSAGVFADADGVVRPIDPRTYRFLPGYLNFEVMANQGAVFGIGQGQRWLFIAVSVAAILFILYLFSASGRQRAYQFILGLLLAGVLGNLYDRAKFGYVRDMIYALPGRMILGHKVFPWIFNVADSLLCVGVVLIFLYSLFVAPRAGRTTDGEKPVGADA